MDLEFYYRIIISRCVNSNLFDNTALIPYIKWPNAGICLQKLIMTNYHTRSTNFEFGLLNYPFAFLLSNLKIQSMAFLFFFGSWNQILQLFSPVHVPRLRVLGVQRNRVRRLPAAVWGAPRLRELQLSGNKLCELGAMRPDSGHARGHGQGRQLVSGMQMQGGAGARIARQRQREAAAEADTRWG